MEKINNNELQKQRLNYLISTLISETDYQIQIPENIKK